MHAFPSSETCLREHGVEDLGGGLLGCQPVGWVLGFVHQDAQDDRQKRDKHGGDKQRQGFGAPQQGDKDEHGQAVLLLPLFKYGDSCKQKT